MRFLVILLTLLLSNTSTGQDTNYNSHNIKVIEQYILDYNAGNLSKMLDQMASNIQWMSIDSNKIITETKNKQQLAQALKPYFKGGNSTQSSLIHVFENGNFVSTLEKASWQSNGQMKSQCSIAIYEFEQNLIKNVWYHTAQPCT